MKLNKILFVSIILLVVVSLGAVSASENTTSDVVADTIVEEVVSDSYESEEITSGGDDSSDIISENTNEETNIAAEDNENPSNWGGKLSNIESDKLSDDEIINIYVSPEGDDTLDGNSPETAVATINQGVTLAGNHVGSKVVINLDGGDYTISNVINPKANSNIVITASADNPAIITSKATQILNLRNKADISFNNLHFNINYGTYTNNNANGNLKFINCSFYDYDNKLTLFSLTKGFSSFINCSFSNIKDTAAIFMVQSKFEMINSTATGIEGIFLNIVRDATLTNISISNSQTNRIISVNANDNLNVIMTNISICDVECDDAAICLYDGAVVDVINSSFINNTGNIFRLDLSNSGLNKNRIDELNVSGSVFINNNGLIVNNLFNQNKVNVDGNWWGSNDGPGDGLVNCSANDWIVIDLVCNPDKAYVGDDISVTARFTNSSSGEVANFETSIPVKFSSESKTLNKEVIIKNGEANVDYTLVANDNIIASFAGYFVSLPAANITLKKGSEIKVVSIDGTKMEVTAILKDSEGNAIANATVLYALNNGEKVNVTTDENGEFSMKVSNNCIVDMVFEGNDLFTQSNSTVTLKNIAPTPKGTTITVDKTFTRTAVDFPAGEKGYMFYFTLKDADGKALANKEAKIGVSGKIYTVKTDKNGKAGLMINLANANVYTYAISFLGDDDYKASFAVSKLTVVKKAVTITPAKTSYTFKSAAKSKVITATLKSTNKFIPAGKKVTLTVGGKTYSAVVAKNGKISLNIAKLTKKGTYKVTIKYAGDGTYKAATSKTITVKIA